MNAIRTAVLLADVAPPKDGSCGGHTAPVVMSGVLSAAVVVVLVHAASQRRR